MPKRFSSATDDVKISGVVIDINREDGSALKIERFREDFDLDEHVKTLRLEKKDVDEDV